MIHSGRFLIPGETVVDTDETPGTVNIDWEYDGKSLGELSNNDIELRFNESHGQLKVEDWADQDNLKFFVDHQIAFGQAQLDAGADRSHVGGARAGRVPGWHRRTARDPISTRRDALPARHRGPDLCLER